MEVPLHIRWLRRLRIVPGFLCVAWMISLVGCKIDNGSFEPPRKQISEPAGAKRPSPTKPQARVPKKPFASEPKNETAPEQHETQHLEVFLNPNLPMDQVPQTMREIVAEISRMLPEQNLVVVAYAPANPPRRLGTALLDAGTGEVTFTWDIPRPNNEEPQSDPSLIRIIRR